MRLHFLLRTAWGTILRKSVRVAYSWGTACSFSFWTWICMRFDRTLRRHIVTIPLGFAFQTLIPKRCRASRVHGVVYAACVHVGMDQTESICLQDNVIGISWKVNKSNSNHNLTDNIFLTRLPWCYFWGIAGVSPEQPAWLVFLTNYYWFKFPWIEPIPRNLQVRDEI